MVQLEEPYAVNHVFSDRVPARVGRYGILNVDAIFQIGYCDITIYCIKNLNQINLFKV